MIQELGKHLWKKGLISKEQLERALEHQREVGGKLSVILIRLGVVDENKLLQTFSDYLNLPISNLDDMVLPEKLIKKVPQDIIERHEILPISHQEDTVTIATFDPYDFDALQEIEVLLDCKVNLTLASRSQILRSINELFHKHRSEQKVKVQLQPKHEAIIEKNETDSEITDNSIRDALIPLLISRGIITKSELIKKAKELGLLE